MRHTNFPSLKNTLKHSASPLILSTPQRHNTTLNSSFLNKQNRIYTDAKIDKIFTIAHLNAEK